MYVNSWTHMWYVQIKIYRYDRHVNSNSL